MEPSLKLLSWFNLFGSPLLYQSASISGVNLYPLYARRRWLDVRPILFVLRIYITTETNNLAPKFSRELL